MDKLNFEELMESVTDKGEISNFCARHIGGLMEADFSESDNDKEKLVKVTVIKAGWSKNGIFYPQKALPQIQEFITSTARKVYVDHNPEGLKGTRYVNEWVADVMEAEVVGDELKATIRVHTDNPNTSWLYERMKTSPDMFGPSIVGAASVKQGEVDGVKGRIVEDIKFIRSFDLVSEPAAGGKVDNVMESILWTDSEDLAEGKMKDHVNTIKERERQFKVREELWTLERALSAIIEESVFAEGELAHHSIEDRKGAISEAATSFVEMVGALEFTAPTEKVSEEVDNKTSRDKEIIKKTKIKENKEFNLMNLTEFKEKYPELAEAFKLEIAESISDEKTKLQTKVTDLEEKISTLDEEKVVLATEKKDLEEKVNTFEDQKLSADKKEIIKAVVKESKIEDTLVTDVFEGTLNAVEYDADKVEKFKESIKALCEDRKGIVKPKGKVNTEDVTKNKNKEEPVSEEVTKKRSLDMIKG